MNFSDWQEKGITSERGILKDTKNYMEEIYFIKLWWKNVRGKFIINVGEFLGTINFTEELIVSYS